MANYTSYPSSKGVEALQDVGQPVPYASLEGLGLVLAGSEVSGQKMVPYKRHVTAAQFAAGDYPFETPAGWTAAPYTLPMLEPITIPAIKDTITALRPVAVYEIGNPAAIDAEGQPIAADLVGADGASFPLNIPTAPYNIGGASVPALAEGQSVIIRLHKVKNSYIQFAGMEGAGAGNVSCPAGLSEKAQTRVSFLDFAVTCKGGGYVVTAIVSPDYYFVGFDGSALDDYGSLAAAWDALVGSMSADLDAFKAETATNLQTVNTSITEVSTAAAAAQSTADAANTKAEEAAGAAATAQSTADAANTKAEEALAGGGGGGGYGLKLVTPLLEFSGGGDTETSQPFTVPRYTPEIGMPEVYEIRIFLRTYEPEASLYMLYPVSFFFNADGGDDGPASDNSIGEPYPFMSQSFAGSDQTGLADPSSNVFEEIIVSLFYDQKAADKMVFHISAFQMWLQGTDDMGSRTFFPFKAYIYY